MLLWLVVGGQAQAGPGDRGDPLLPEAASVLAALAASPAMQAAQSHIESERAVQRQYQVGPHEWTATASAARRDQSRPLPENTVEWELGLARAIRLPAKREAYDRAGERRVAQAQLALRRVWGEQARWLLERHANWLGERESARIWRAQAKLLRQYVEAVTQRQRLGDAPRIERAQAEAAGAQADAQLATSSGRAQAAREALLQRYPGLALLPDEALPLPEPLVGADGEWIAAQLRHSPELAAAQGETAVAQAQLGVDSAERRPDPTLGLRVGRARSGAEQTVGLVLSLPFGGDYRAAGEAAARARADTAAWQQVDTQRRVEVEATQHLRDAQVALAGWQRHADAAQQLALAADSLARGYLLGEGSLADLLAARRLANEQQLTATASLVEVWLARHRLQLEAGALWPLDGR
jgi:cobalt-zinc-cadmium efflux system outer membrane protein